MSAILAALLTLSFTASALEVIPDDQWVTAKDVVSFQPFADTTNPITVGGYQVTLTNLNRNINSWYLLTLVPDSRWKKTQVFNLENPIPQSQRVALLPDGKIQLQGANGESAACDLIGTDGAAGAAWDALGADPYMPLCGGKLYLRNRADGHKDAVSWATTNLRDIFGDAGDQVVNLVKEELYDGKFFEGGQETKEAQEVVVSEGGPDAAKISEPILITNSGIGIQIADKAQGMTIGQWYKSANFNGVYVSAMKAKYVDKEILKSFKDRVRPIDNNGGGEGDALVDSVAIDISQYRFGWTNGTEHPGVGWSSRATNPHNKLPGPDGFNTTNPLVLPGVLSPYDASQAVAVLTGGFQRHHSAFKSGPLTGANRSHHYGFMEKGVVMSTLVPNLASFIIYQDGSMDLKTWTLADNQRLNTMRDVRQNGVPLIENGEPTVYVNQWGAGNWSGSADKELKTPRTSACLIEKEGRKWLVLSYFSTHTPSGMARVLQSYGCNYAIHLDMNSPRFAYTAFFTNTADGDFNIEHLANSMVDDVIVNGKKAPRSLLTPTYKDFFYVMKKKNAN